MSVEQADTGDATRCTRGYVTRRGFSVAVAATATTAATLGSAQAQGALIEGKQYLRLSPPVPVSGDAAGKVEVIEFFWYGCPHCNRLEPHLAAWAAKLPPDVLFRRVPVAFAPMHEYHLRLYYALEAMGQLQANHAKVFAAIHVANNRLTTDEAVGAWAKSVGLDGAKLVQTMASFSMAAKVAQAKQLGSAYRLDGVPTIGVQGRYTTSPQMANSETTGVFPIVDALIAMARKQA